MLVRDKVGIIREGFLEGVPLKSLPGENGGELQAERTDCKGVKWNRAQPGCLVLQGRLAGRERGPRPGEARV